MTLPGGTTVDSPGVAEELAEVFGAVEAAAPATRVVSYATTADRAVVRDDGRTTLGLIYLPNAGQGASPDEAAVTAVLADRTVDGAAVSLTGLWGRTTKRTVAPASGAGQHSHRPCGHAQVGHWPLS